MFWEAFTKSVEEKLKTFPAPDYLAIQLGSNDLGTIRTKALIEDIKTDLLRVKLLMPNTKIVWSDILMRRYWHNAEDGKGLEKARIRLNLDIKKFVIGQGGFVIRHPNIRASEKDLYRFDGTHPSDIGYSVYLNNVQAAFEQFLSFPEYKIFPIQ